MQYYIVNSQVKNYASKASRYCVLDNAFICKHINNNRSFTNLRTSRYYKSLLDKLHKRNKFSIVGAKDEILSI